MPHDPSTTTGSRDGAAGNARRIEYLAPANALRTLRAAAREVAASTLEGHGFVAKASSGDHWTGWLHLPRSRMAVPVDVWLPETFPDALPKVAVSKGYLQKRIAHVNVDGSVCLVPTSNVLVDADRPEALVDEALRLAADVLDRGLQGETDGDLDVEFQAYWEPTDRTPVLSLCNADGPARRIVTCQLMGGSSLVDGRQIVADRTEDVERWARHIGVNPGPFYDALFIPVSASVPLALPEEATRLSEIWQLVDRYGTAHGQQLFREVIEHSDYPQLILLSMPEAPLGTGRRLAAVLIRRPEQELFKRAKRGFRPDRVPASWLLRWMRNEPVERLSLKRVDRAYLVARGGAAGTLGEATVTVVGVGAIGSDLARNLAALGVGHIRLVDPDEMQPENVHRHALGMNSAGRKKVDALMDELRRCFPHLDIDSRPLSVETLLTMEPTFLLDSNLIVLSTGEETLERRLNRLLLNGPPRLHTWLEALGIAGHAFACGGRTRDTGSSSTTRGCFECLYRPDDEFGLVNRTALTAAGQDIRRSLAGCAGTFSPFSPLDARRTAVDAAELAARVLTGATTPPVLISWRALHSEFEAAGYRLSGRASNIPRGTRCEVSGTDLVRDDCAVCGARVAVDAMPPAVDGPGRATP